MRISFLIICTLFALLSHGQIGDSLRYYYNTYQFQNVINHVENNESAPAKELFLAGKSYVKLGQFNDAEKAFLEAVALDTTNTIYLSQLADFQVKRNKGHLAFIHYQKLIRQHPGNAYYYKKLGQAISSTNYTSIKNQLILESNQGVYPESEDLKEQIIKQIFEANYITHATTAYEKAIALNPKDIESKLILTQIYLDQNLIGLADSFIQQCLKDHPNNKNFIMQAIKVAHRLKDYEDVVEKSNLFYASADSNLLVQKLEGIAHFHLKEYKVAIRLLTNVMQVETNNEVLSYFLGLAYQELGFNQQAILHLENAIDYGITENIDNYYVRLASVYEAQENYEKSIQLYKAAYSKSKEKILLYHLARNYDVFYKDKTTALKYYQLYLEENDTINEAYFDFTRNRISELKVAKHFDLDTL